MITASDSEDIIETQARLREFLSDDSEVSSGCESRDSSRSPSRSPRPVHRGAFRCESPTMREVRMLQAQLDLMQTLTKQESQKNNELQTQLHAEQKMWRLEAKAKQVEQEHARSHRAAVVAQDVYEMQETLENQETVESQKTVENQEEIEIVDPTPPGIQLRQGCATSRGCTMFLWPSTSRNCSR